MNEIKDDDLRSKDHTRN